MSINTCLLQIVGSSIESYISLKKLPYALRCGLFIVIGLSIALLGLPVSASEDETTLQALDSSTGNGAERRYASSGSHGPLPVSWVTLTHSEWLDALDIASCEAENQGSEARRKKWVRLDDSNQLLLLTCGFGAYQDAFHVYTVNVENRTVTPVMLQTPNDEGDSVGGILVRGTLYKGDQGDVVELLHLSAATGACGWRSLYPLDDVKRGGSVKPEQVFGDDDCYNGVTVENWPAIE